jgi:CubicO group peptidase (beta-lactamase class C family)
MIDASAYLGNIATASAVSRPKAASKDRRTIDETFMRAAAAGDVAGVVGAAATKDGIICEGGFGKANVETGSLIGMDTVFWLLSMTKAFTATAWS